jgi:hypothetical protein
MQRGPDVRARSSPLVLMSRGWAEKRKDVCYRPSLNADSNKTAAATSASGKASIIASVCSNGTTSKSRVSGMCVAKYANVICFHTTKSTFRKSSHKSIP